MVRFFTASRPARRSAVDARCFAATGLLTRAPKGSLLDADQGARLDAD